MPKLRTEYARLATGIYAARRGSAIHIVTTSDEQPPDQATADQRQDEKGTVVPILAKQNWLRDEEIDRASFAQAVGTVFPEWKGELVNVGTEEDPFLLTQEQAEQYQRHLAVAIEAAREAA